MNSNQLIERKARLAKLDRALKKLFPQAKIELNFSTPWELLVAVQLSAQCTDKRVNLITATLFAKYPTLADYVRAGKTAKGITTFENDIRSSGFFRNKAKNILAAAKMIAEKHNENVPRTLAELIRIPGVGRKTATVVLAAAYGRVEGITVDTHVIRFVRRFDLSDYKDPIRIERDLMQLLPRREWATFVHRVIFYGRYLAPARPYDTANDPLVAIYPPAGTRFRA